LKASANGGSESSLIRRL